MKAYVIVNVDVHDAERYAEYIRLAPPTIAQHGGRYLVRGGRSERLEGDVAVNRVVIVEFPSFERAKAWHDSEAYRSAMAVRHAASSGSMILVEGLP
jgi:uncharacterized protein (DUF1330 family)